MGDGFSRGGPFSAPGAREPRQAPTGYRSPGGPPEFGPADFFATADESLEVLDRKLALLSTLDVDALTHKSLAQIRATMHEVRESVRSLYAQALVKHADVMLDGLRQIDESARRAFVLAFPSPSAPEAPKETAP